MHLSTTTLVFLALTLVTTLPLAKHNWLTLDSSIVHDDGVIARDVADATPVTIDGYGIVQWCLTIIKVPENQVCNLKPTILFLPILSYQLIREVYSWNSTGARITLYVFPFFSFALEGEVFERGLFTFRHLKI